MKKLIIILIYLNKLNNNKNLLNQEILIYNFMYEN